MVTSSMITAVGRLRTILLVRTLAILPLLFLIPPFGFSPVLLGYNPLRINAALWRDDQVITRIRSLTTYPSTPLTCHHFVPPTVRFTISSPPRACIRYSAASSQHDMGIRTRTTRTHGGEGVRVLAKD